MKSINLELAATVASAVDELGIIGARPVISFVPQYDTQSEKDLKCVIVPGLYALQRIARDGVKETAAVGVVLYKNVSDQGDVVNNTSVCDEYIALLQQIALSAVTAVFTMEDGGEYHVVDVQTDMLYDPVQLERYYVYNGALTITFERHARIDVR